MSIERASGDSSLIDVLDRVLDKGIVIDAWVRLSLVGIDLDLVTVERARRDFRRSRDHRKSQRMLLIRATTTDGHQP